MGYKASIICCIEKHWYWFMCFQLCSVHFILGPVWGEKPLQPQHVLRTGPLLLFSYSCYGDKYVSFQKCFWSFVFSWHSALPGHFIALWHAGANFMACSVVEEYLLFPRMSVKQADKPSWCLAHPTVCFPALAGFSSLWNPLICTSLWSALFVLWLCTP